MQGRWGQREFKKIVQERKNYKMEVNDDADITIVKELDRSRQKGIRLTVDNLYNRLLKVDPKFKHPLLEIS